MRNILFFLILVLPLGAGAMSMFRESKEFKFENYDNAEEAKETLLRMHPIGSPVDNLIKTLERAGASVEEIPDKNKKFLKIDTKLNGIKHYSYFQKTALLGYKWGGGIIYDLNNNSIVDVGVNRTGEAF